MTLASSISQLILAKRVQQNLKANPNDLDSLVLLASMIKDDPALKRGVVDRILKLDPINQTGRAMLLDLDRAEMFNVQSLPAVPIVQTPVVETTHPIQGQVDKPIVSIYSILHQILVYPVVLFFIPPLFLAIQAGDGIAIAFFIGVLLLLMIPVWFISAVVVVDHTGIKLSRLFGIYRREIDWKEIESIKSNPMGVGMNLTSREGVSLKISSQMRKYASIVKTLQSIRPDLFTLGESKTFQKGFLGKYGWFFLVVPMTLLTPGALLTPPFLPGLIIAVIVFFFWKTILNAPHTIQVQGNQLIARSFRAGLEITAHQVKDISVVTVHNRRGVAKNLIQIQYHEKDELSFTGFPEGNEVMYGYLKNWWMNTKDYRMY